MASFSARLDPFLDRFFKQQERQAAQLFPLAADAMSRYRKFMSGGKMGRGALVELGYQCFGGKNLKAILPVAAAVEIYHSFLLMHDDIIDQDDTRRGKPSMHKQYQALVKEQFPGADPIHYGQALTIFLGDIGSFLATQLITESKFDPQLRLKALSWFCQVLIGTGYGEILDVVKGLEEYCLEEEVLLIHRLKTARYTIVGPLQLGAILAGAHDSDLKNIEKFGVPVGLAFQIQDDILGMFGNEEELGKSASSDLREGKNTLLVLHARQNASKEQLATLNQVYGNRRANDRDIEAVRKIFQATGALDKSQQMAQALVQDGKMMIPRIVKTPKYANILASLADFTIERKF